ncbi:MAG: hypothetical protein Q8M29_19175 [Bacteroidota bacterium]|nr:hypothetical protein [Bacteroidota bacterium]
MKKLPIYTLLISILSFTISCQSDTDKANEVLNLAIQMNEAAKNQPAIDSGKLAIQNSTYTAPVTIVPTQQELIKKHKVKTIKETYEGGWTISTYDKKGNRISEETDYTGKKTYTYEFDKKGQVIKEKTKYRDGTTFSYQYEYNEEGKVISKTFTDSDGKTSVTKFEFNKDLGTRIESSSSGTDKEFYDNRGLRVRFESYDNNKKLVGSGEAQYNEDGLKISEKASVFGMSTNDEFEYNEAGQLIKQHRTGIVDTYFLFEYNEKGLTTSSKNVKGMQEDETKYEYIYY